MLFRDLLMLSARQGGSAAPAIDADAALYFAAVVTAGGTVSDVRKSIVNTFFLNEKASGAWTLTDDYWGLWAENATQALVSLKQRRTATVTAAPTFTADNGYTFNGTSNFINTGFVPSTHCVAGSGTNQRIAVYERVNVATATYAMGAFTSGTVNWRLQPRSAANAMVALLNSGNASATLSVANSQGYSAMSRASGGTVAIPYKNGAALTSATGLTVGTTLTANAVYIGAFNNAGSAAGFRPTSIGMTCIGAPLSAAQELAQYNNVQQWGTAVGGAV